MSEIDPIAGLIDLENVPSMGELLGENVKHNFIENSIIKGRIVEKRDNGVLIDIGYKAEGFISSEDFKNWDKISPGDVVDVFLEEIENKNNMPGLSVSKASMHQAWDNFTAKYQEGATVKGFLKHRVKGGVIVEIDDVEAFLPGSQLDITVVKNMDDFVGKDFELKVLKINQERKNIVVSRRELLEADRAGRRATLLKDMKVGDRKQGLVKNITDFGAFIDLGGLDGLLHITDMSWKRISHPSEMLEIGQDIEAVILAIDLVKERVSLGLKQKTENPWDNIENKYPVASTVRGRVVNIMPYGAFLEISEGIEGLIHVSEMSWTKRITKAGDILAVGEEVDAVVLDIQKEKKKISLGLRQTTRNPWEILAEKYPSGSRIRGKVRNMTSYGAFIEIENDIDGMVHVSDMSWTRKINNPNEILKQGQEVDAVVLEIDPPQQRISLGIKQLENDPWSNIESLYKIGDLIKGNVSKITPFGAFVELSNKIDGLIHISQISDEHVKKVKDVLSIGQELEARVIKIDKDMRRIGLSVKAAKENFSEEQLKAAGEEVAAALGSKMIDVEDILDEESLAALDSVNTSGK